MTSSPSSFFVTSTFAGFCLCLSSAITLELLQKGGTSRYLNVFGSAYNVSAAQVVATFKVTVLCVQAYRMMPRIIDSASLSGNSGTSFKQEFSRQVDHTVNASSAYYSSEEPFSDA
jgi:hypothetical protein